jgi:hypothetical protein
MKFFGYDSSMLTLDNRAMSGAHKALETDVTLANGAKTRYAAQLYRSTSYLPS